MGFGRQKRRINGVFGVKLYEGNENEEADLYPKDLPQLRLLSVDIIVIF